jgi:hypothetical protein
MQPLMLRITEDKAEVLQSDGWHEFTAGEFIQMPGGNYLAVNSEGHMTGLIQGFAFGICGALIILGVYAGAVS